MKRLSIITVALLSLASCTFSLDRSLATGEIRGRAVFALSGGAQTPAVGAHVVLEDSSVAVDADSSGVFSIAGLPPGTYALTITGSQTGSNAATGLRIQGLMLTAIGSGQADSLDLGTLTLGAFGSISGTVSLGGALAPGAVVVITGLVQTTATDGTFTFANLAPGQYSLAAILQSTASGASASAPVTVTVSPRASTSAALELTAAAFGGIAGQVDLANGGSLMGAKVQLDSPGTSGASATPGGTDGLYSQSSLQPGVYSVTANDPGYTSVTVSFLVVGGGTTQVPAITLVPGPAGTIDAGSNDAGTMDAGSNDAGSMDGGPADSGPADGGALDAGQGTQTVPAAPMGVSATGGNSQVTITWNPVSNAVSYNLYYSTTPLDQTDETEQMQVMSPYVLTGLDTATTYYVAVTAVNSAGESIPSTAVVTGTLTDDPSGVVATIGDGQITVTWAPVTGAVSYNLYYSMTSGSARAGTQMQDVVSPDVVMGLTDGTPYYIVVTAVDAGGESAGSSEVSATPSIVSGVVATAGNGQVALSWNAVPNANAYNIYRSVGPGTGASFANVGSNDYTDSSVTNYTDYFYTVTAVVSGAESSPSPQVSGTPAAWLMVSVADGNALGITDDHRLWSWGRTNIYGALGLDSSIAGPVFTPTQVGTAANWTSVSAGYYASFGVTSDGRLWAWGSDGPLGGVGILGQGMSVPNTVYSPITVGTGTTWFSVATANSGNVVSTLGLTIPGSATNDGNVWAWGGLSYTMSEAYQPTIQSSFHSTAIANGWGQMLQLAGGLLYSSGADMGTGILGQGALAGEGDVSFPQQVGILSNWTSIAAGNYQSLGVAGGALYSWGSDMGTGALGQGANATAPVTTPTQVGISSKWVSVAAGYDSSFAIDTDGSLWAWGTDNGTGNLGLGSGQGVVYVPTQVGLATNWSSVSAGILGTMAIDTSNNLWGWGPNSAGSLGMSNSVANVFTPTQVSLP